MSWDIFLLKMDNPIPIEELENDAALPPLGSRKEVIDIISKAFPGVIWDDPSWGYYKDTETKFVIEFSLGESEDVSSIILRIEGDALPKESILLFCKTNNLQALDLDASKYII